MCGGLTHAAAFLNPGLFASLFEFFFINFQGYVDLWSAQFIMRFSYGGWEQSLGLGVESFCFEMFLKCAWGGVEKKLHFEVLEVEFYFIECVLIRFYFSLRLQTSRLNLIEI